MPRATFSPEAEKDFDAIADYIADDDIETAKQFVALLKEKCFRIAETPGIGRVREEVAPALHFFPVGRYVIAYNTTAYGIHVVRVIHAARDFHTFFR